MRLWPLTLIRAARSEQRGRILPLDRRDAELLRRHRARLAETERTDHGSNP